MELEVGMYVRSKKYGIARIVPNGRYFINNNGDRTIYVDRPAIHSEIEFADYVWSKDITKASYNIIDLIEVGDILVLDLWQHEDSKQVVYDDDGIKVVYMYDMTIPITNDEIVIKSIVTKEQFEAMKYEIN